MNEPLWIWTKLFLRLAMVLLGLGLLPLMLVTYVFTDVSPLVPVLLSLLVAPIGGVCLLVAAILFLAARLRRPRGPS